MELLTHFEVKLEKPVSIFKKITKSSANTKFLAINLRNFMVSAVFFFFAGIKKTFEETLLNAYVHVFVDALNFYDRSIIPFP